MTANGLRRAVALVGVAVVSAAVGLCQAGTAHAGPVGASGYVWANQPTTASYTAATGFEYNSSGGAIRIARAGVGLYSVTFQGAAAPRAVAHAGVYGSGVNGTCALSTVEAVGADELLKVRCADATGAPADQQFVADMTNRRSAGVDLAYLIADRPGAGTPYTPTVSYDSDGTVDTVARFGPGVYNVTLGLAQRLDFYADPVHVQVTALTSTPGVHCQNAGPQDEVPVPLAVVCGDAWGFPVDTAFTLTFVHYGNLLGGYAPPFADAEVQPTWDTGAPVVRTWFSTVGVAPTVTHPARGQYRVSFPWLTIGRGHAMVLSTGNANASCTIVAWSSFGIDVQCWDYATHTPVDSEFDVALMS